MLMLTPERENREQRGMMIAHDAHFIYKTNILHMLVASFVASTTRTNASLVARDYHRIYMHIQCILSGRGGVVAVASYRNVFSGRAARKNKWIAARRSTD